MSNDFDDIPDILAEYGLPELPEADPDSEDTVSLMLFRFQQENIPLADNIPRREAVYYCQREDTHGDGWFAGWRR